MTVPTGKSLSFLREEYPVPKSSMAMLIPIYRQLSEFPYRVVLVPHNAGFGYLDLEARRVEAGPAQHPVNVRYQGVVAELEGGEVDRQTQLTLRTHSHLLPPGAGQFHNLPTKFNDQAGPLGDGG